MALGALWAPVHGSEPNAALCSNTAPWILEDAPDAGAPAAAPDAPVLDVATYNLHSGLGLHHAFFRSRVEVEHNLRAIAASIATAARDAGGPDVVGLNEVDFAARRSAWVDEAAFLADELQAITGSAYQVIRGETWRRTFPGMEVRFGNAALVRLPVVHAVSCLFDDLSGCELGAAPIAPLPRRAVGILGRVLREPRGVIRVTVDVQGRPVDVLVTHLDAFAMQEREQQAAVLLSRFLNPERTTILLGDMNAVPTPLTRNRWMFSADRTHAILATGNLADAAITLASCRRQKSLTPWATFPADAPVWGLDWVLASPDLAPQDMATIGDSASDHRGLFVRYRVLRDDVAIDAWRARHQHVCERLRAFDSACGPTRS